MGALAVTYYCNFDMCDNNFETRKCIWLSLFIHSSENQTSQWRWVGFSAQPTRVEKEKR